MPAWVDTKEEEQAWQKAVKIVEKQRDKSKSEFTDSDYGLVTHIAKNILKSHVMKSADDTVLYYISKVSNLMSARNAKKAADDSLEGPTGDIMAALKRVMGSGGQVIAALRKAKGTDMSDDDAMDFAEDLEDIADQLEDLLERMSE